jgi:hypothetical protein
VKVRWIIIAVGIICLAVVITTLSVVGWWTSISNENNEEVSVEEAKSLFYHAVAYAQVRDLDKLCDLCSSEGICRHQWEWAGGEQAVPAEPPEIVDTYLLPTVHLENGGKAVGGRVLVLEGVDGLGKPYRTEFFVFRSRDSGLNGLAVTNGVYWSGYGIAQCDENGSVELGPRIGTASLNGSLVGTEDVSLMQAPQYWSSVALQCFARIESVSGWIDHCCQLYKLVGDNNNEGDYYQLVHYATARSKTIFSLRSAWIECVKHESSSTMGWLDWSPGSDLNVGRCTPITIERTINGSSMGGTFTVYKSGWDITKYAEAGKFANRWYGRAWHSERDVAYMVGVAVPQGGWPVWSLAASYFATI